MRRNIVAAAALAAALAAPSAYAHLDHPVPTISGTAPPLSTEFNSGGENADWELLATIPTANPHSDLDFFTQNGEMYASVGVLGIAANGGGQNILRLTNKDGEVEPELVANHPSAACPQDPSASLGLQHDVEATPKGEVILNTSFARARRTDAQLLIDATDAAGRCHDQGTGGIQSAPRGGLEIIDITDVTQPKEIGLTSHIGQSHTVNVDPRRPHIAYSVTSDRVPVNAEGTRANETATDTGRFAHDGFEVVDLRSCLEAPLGTIPPGTSIADKRNLCKPQVYRYRWPSVDIALGHTNRDHVYGCHELELYPDDRLTCAGGAAMMMFDMSGAFDDNGTPADFTDDKPRGTPLPCKLRDSSTTIAAYRTGAKVTDCVFGEMDGKPVDLGIPGWKEIGSPSLEGVQHLGSAFHQGRETSTGALDPAYPATEDIDFDHEAELTHSRRFVIASDERGGGVTGGAQCSPGVDLQFANGGLHAYSVDRLLKSTPKAEDAEARAAAAFQSYARTSKGDKSIFRAPVRTQPQASFCTAHVFQQIPGQNRIFMGWYSQGTQVVDFKENPDGTLDFEQAGYFVPEGANQWVSHIFKVDANPDGTFTYYGATGDGIVGDAGRNGMDVYKVTLPAPPAPAPRAAGVDEKESGGGQGGANSNPRSGGGSGQENACAQSSGFQRVSARARGRGLRISFVRRETTPVSVDVFQAARKSKPTKHRRVARFTGRRKGFTWSGRRGGRFVPNGVYFVRYRTKAPDGSTDTRTVTLVRRNGRFRLAREHQRGERCGLVSAAALSSPAFGGPRGKALGITFRLAELARVTVLVKRKDKVVKRWRTRAYEGGRTIRLKLPAAGTRRGEHRVVIVAERGTRRATVRLSSRRL
ncbi:MAG TPA: hypothetical protein VM266_15950 [Solirubrobacteraceae bacterium]|nr:hypothetical protein [Solirubrobacteraceae bacterium]